MPRKPGTDCNGNQFSCEIKNKVWAKAKPISDKLSKSDEGKDMCNAFIKYSDYGNISSSTGWEIDHIKPVSEGGTDDIDNLQPLQWKNNRGKGDNYPCWHCTVPTRIKLPL